MKKKLTSLVVATGMILTLGVVGAGNAQADTRQTRSTQSVSSFITKPNFVPPTDGGGTSPAPGDSNSAGQQVCSVVTYIAGYVGFWQKIADINKWVEVAIYSSALVCNIIYR